MLWNDAKEALRQYEAIIPNKILNYKGGRRMKKKPYLVNIVEALSRRVIIYADPDDKQYVEDLAMKIWENSKVILDADDFDSVETIFIGEAADEEVTDNEIEKFSAEEIEKL